MELYTSLTRLKQALNDGELPPMIPISQQARAFIDPALTPGHGALNADELLGLQCPVRGCGKWVHVLSTHLNFSHKNIGGAAGVRAALGIPKRVAMMSQQAREKIAGNGRRLNTGSADRVRQGRSRVNESTRIAASKASRNSPTYKNLRDRCEAQLSHKLIDLHHRLGRSPTVREGEEFLGRAVVNAIKETFGTWNNAKMQCGLESHITKHSKYSRDAILEALRAWYDEHGELPNVEESSMPTRTPLIPQYATIVRAFGRAGWRVAMRQVAALLNIRGGRYGLPEMEGAA